MTNYFYNKVLYEEDDAKFKKRPIPVTAIQKDEEFSCDTKEGPVTGSPGSWLVKGPEGEEWPVDDKIFRKTYEPLNPEAREALGEGSVYLEYIQTLAGV